MSSKSRTAYNLDKSKSVVLTKMKEFSIEPYGIDHFIVKGWYNKENFFTFGIFSDREKAQIFLESIHKML